MVDVHGTIIVTIDVTKSTIERKNNGDIKGKMVITMLKDKWDKQFSSSPFTYGKTVNQFIKNNSQLFTNESQIACFAEGEGRNAVYLAKQGHLVTAFDYSFIGLQNAQILAQENTVKLKTIVADLTLSMEQVEKYDAAIMVFGHVAKNKQAAFIENLINSVKANGYIMFEVYSEAQIDYETGGPGNLAALYNPIDVLKWIAPYHCKHFYYGEADRQEGYRHTGIGHVIQVIIQK